MSYSGGKKQQLLEQLLAARVTLLNRERFKLYFKHTRKDSLLEYKTT